MLDQKKTGMFINELLSGERLSEDAYNGKAENNMVELIKDNEKTKRENTGAVIGTIIGGLLLCLFIYGITVISGGMAQIIWFLDAPSLVAVLGIQFIILGASGQFYNYFRSFRLVFAPKSYNHEELKLLADKSEYAVSFGIKAILLAGALSSIIGFVIFFSLVVNIAKFIFSLNIGCGISSKTFNYCLIAKFRRFKII